MYHLTPVEAMFLVMFLAVLFMVRGTKKAAKKADKKFLYSLPETEEPLRQGYSFLYCMEMRDRGMMYRDGQCISRTTQTTGICVICYAKKTLHSTSMGGGILSARREKNLRETTRYKEKRQRAFKLLSASFLFISSR